MTPLEFLNEERENVEFTLLETLRHDYVPERSRAFFQECVDRLGAIKRSIDALDRENATGIRENIQQLRSLANWIALIERSHLGEFSWPFAMLLEDIAKALLWDINSRRRPQGVVTHVIADGGSTYRIQPEKVTGAGAKRRFVIVSFPRQLKHHVLLHSIFGHELGHSALITQYGKTVAGPIRPTLVAEGPLENTTKMAAWLGDANAPADVAARMARLKHDDGPFQVHPDMLESWKKELLCDLIGLLLFGPAFLASHRVLLSSDSFRPHVPIGPESTHPPYAIRVRALTDAMHVLEWDKCVCAPGTNAYEAEAIFLEKICASDGDGWSQVFRRENLLATLNHLQAHIPESCRYNPPNPDILKELIERIAQGRPPICANIDEQGNPLLRHVTLDEVLYAGWTYWYGKAAPNPPRTLTFRQINHLCHLAILQQNAIGKHLARA